MDEYIYIGGGVSSVEYWLYWSAGRGRTIVVELVRNVMAHGQKPDLVFQRNGRVHLNRRGCQFSRLLAIKECGSADSNCIDRAPSSSSRLLATHSIRIFPLHFPSRASPCAIRFRTSYNIGWTVPSQNEACLATHSIRLFPLHLSSRASPCATRFRFHSTNNR